MSFGIGVYPRLLFNDIFSNISSAFSISTKAQSRLFAGADTKMLPSSGEMPSSPSAVICFRRGSGRGFGADADELPLDIEDAASIISTEVGQIACEWRLCEKKRNLVWKDCAYYRR